MKTKKKLLWVSDVNKATGFGQIADAMLPYLNNTGEWDIAAMGINYRGGRHGYGSNVHIYPCDSQDPYGFSIFPNIVQQERPDVIFILQDLFVVKKYFEFLRFLSEKQRNIPTVVYFPIDGPSVPDDWMQVLEECSVPVAYSEYGRDLIYQLNPKVRGKIGMVYHGIDHDTFRPLDPKDRELMKRQNNVLDKFVVGVINRFQPRKMVPLAIRAFSLFYNGYKVCSGCGNYYLHTIDKCDLNGCVGDHKSVPGKKDSVLYLHMNTIERMMGGETNTLQMSAKCAGIDPSMDCIMTPGVDIYGPMAPNREEMNKIYNMLDVYLAADCGEGFGLTQMEAMSVGLPIVKSNNTTGPELVGDYASMAKSCGFFTMGHDSGHYRPVVDVPALVDGLEKVYAEWSKNKTIPLSQEQHQYTIDNFDWQDKAISLERAIKDALTIGKSKFGGNDNKGIIEV